MVYKASNVTTFVVKSLANHGISDDTHNKGNDMTSLGALITRNFKVMSVVVAFWSARFSRVYDDNMPLSPRVLYANPAYVVCTYSTIVVAM
jgi:hypothetical protein